MATGSDFQALFDLVIVFEGGDHENGDRLEYGKGDRIPAKKLGSADRDRYLEVGAIRPWKDGEALPDSTNPDADTSTLTQPDGSPLELAPVEETTSDFKPARSHAEADAKAAELGVTFPDGTKLDAKNDALRQVVAAGGTGAETTPGGVATEDISTLSDDELVQRAIDYGHTEDETDEMSHDELVLFVAEAMARQGGTPEAQAASVAEREANPPQE